MAPPANPQVPSPETQADSRVPVLDVHVHLAGLGGGGSGCRVSPAMRRSLVFGILRRWLRLDPEDPEADASYARTLAGLLDGAAHVDLAVVLGLDGVYDESGRLDPERSHLMVPNRHVFDVCRRHRCLLPGVSIHPGRPDALEELARCDDDGAVLVKWLPPLQLFDPSEARYHPFYRELARRGLPLLSHTGCEHTFPDVHHELAYAERLRPALEEGVTVIAAHCGTACRLHRAHDRSRQVLEMMNEFPNLYADTSALASLLKFQYLQQLPIARRADRFLHGSDYPIPCLALPFVRALGLARALRLTFGANPIEADWEIKQAVGFPAEVFTNAGRLLAPRITKWRTLGA
ncbi:MAG: amidohydrolase family protein [Candidatus Riflebacteria bacterium]|nr:amidohydrolase family protein [Candidatus Riflebacteria bacterium]